MHKGWMLIGLCLVGCARTPELVKAPPVSEDLVGWMAPTAVAEEVAVPESPVEPPEARSPQEKVYPYKPGECYRADVAVGRPLLVMFQPGEEIHNIADGDRSRMSEEQEKARPWEIQQGYSGAGRMGRPVLLITVPQAGLQNGVTVTTTRRAYCLESRSVAKSSIRSIRWTYEDEPQVAKQPRPRLLPDPMVPQRYHVGYEISHSEPKPIWTVRQVVDNGAKTYLIFPPTLATIEAPLVRAVGVNGPELINSRQVGSVIVLDRIINRVEMRIGTGKTAEVVVVQRQEPRTITCPGDEACPVWPGTAMVRQEVTP
jgi:type IV secretory pathway VirB9-like protein